MVEIELPVRFDAPPEGVENAFLILTVRWRAAPWRILTRITVRADAEGAPDAEVQNVTIQPVGFSERR